MYYLKRELTAIPHQRPCISFVEERGKKVLYARLKKALYGCIRSALLWYELYSGTLKKMGFKINRVDNCVASRLYNGHRCDIGWYVDDNIILCKDDRVVSTVIEKIEERFGKMTVTRGTSHVFLGMTIEFKPNGTVEIDTIEYLREAIDEFGERCLPKSPTPAGPNILQIDPTSARLDTHRADVLHSIVAKMLWVRPRSRLDIAFTISFMCTRVGCSTEEDWVKLRRLMGYINNTIHKKRILGADSLIDLSTWIDSAYAIHSDMKGHTGGAMSFGTGVFNEKSTKQRINALSSTESEFVGNSEYIPNNIWMENFLRELGYNLRTNKLFQDNQSTIKMLKNGRRSCSSRSKHIGVRYFFIKDRIDNGTIDVEYCPTEIMLADFFTKALQGNGFRKFRDVVLGEKHIDSLRVEDGAIDGTKERVGT